MRRAIHITASSKFTYLVRGNEVRIVNRRERRDLLHVVGKLTLEVVVEHLGTLHGVLEVEAADVPAGDDEVVRAHHGEHVREGNVDLTAPKPQM